MLQTLISFASIEVSIVSGLYKVVAKVFDILLMIVHDSGDLTGTTFEELLVTCYVLAGVFMLFRVAIGMIQMIINPDQVSDAKTGAGKLMTRVILSICMLILFVPNGILFAPYKDGKGGIFPRIEHALIGDNGLIMNLINQKTQFTENGAAKKATNSSTSNLMIENVYADSMKKPLTCYFVQTPVRKTESQVVGKTVTKKKTKSYDKNAANYGIIKITFNSSGDGPRIKNSPLAYEGYTKNHVGETQNTSDGKPVTFIGYYGNTKYRIPKLPITSGPFNSYYPKNCNEIVLTPPSSEDSASSISIGVVSKATKSNKAYNHSTSGGYNTLDNAYKRMIKEGAKDLQDGVSEDQVKKAMPTEEDFNGAKEESENKGFLQNLKYNQSIKFAQGTASSFQECANGKEEECEKAQEEMFITSEGDKDLASQVDDGNMDIGFIISMVAGIGLIVYLIVLCVDVIVRRFKLMLLEVMAPIPAISYVSPNDKVFPQWMKMYLSTYIDLFIKLIAIALALGLLSTVFGWNNETAILWNEGGLLLRFFYIVAILVFAKIVPSMISKLFGLDSLGGSFKDILGMGKAAAGFGAGAIIGGAVGGITGAMAGASGRKNGLSKVLGGVGGLASGALGGTVSGAGSGSKGNLFGGANSISARNAKEAAGRKSGLGFFERKMAAVSGALGLSQYDSMAEEQMKKAKAVGDANKALKDYALGEVQKKGLAFNSQQVKQLTHDSNGNWKGIVAKDDSNKVVAGGRRDAFGIDMKSEYNKLSSLGTMTTEDYASSSDKITDSDGNVIKDYQDALRFQQQRVTALEDYAVAEKINSDNSAEMRQFIGAYNDAYDEAISSGVTIKSNGKNAERVQQGSVTNKTLSTNKDAAIEAQLEIGQKHEKAIKRSQYNSMNSGK